MIKIYISLAIFFSLTFITSCTPSRIFEPTVNIGELPWFHQGIESFSEEYTSKEIEEINSSLDILRIIINSEEFEKEILKLSFYDNGGVTPIVAKTILTNIYQHQENIRYRKADYSNHVVATGGGNTITFNRTRDDIHFGGYLIEVLLHEMTHTMGYSHASGVPYPVGGLVNRLYRELTDQGYFQHVKPYYCEENLPFTI